MPTSCRPNRATGTRTQLSIQEERCWGQLSATENSLGIDYTQEALEAAIASIQSNLIRADRMEPPPQQGNQEAGGSISGEFQPNGIWPLVWLHFMGGTDVVSGSGPYTHNMKGSVLLPEGLTIEKNFGFPDGTKKILRYLGSMVQTINLDAKQGAICLCSADFLSKQQLEVFTPMDVSPTFPANNEPYNGFQGAIYLDSSGSGSRVLVATIQSFSMTATNGFDPNQFAMDGTNTRADIPEDRRSISGKMTAFFTDTNWALYQSFLANTSLSLEFKLTRGSNFVSVVIPSFKVTGKVTPQVGGRGPLSLPIDWKAFRNDDLLTDMIVTWRNNDPVISTAA